MHCCVAGCVRNNKNKKISFYRLPKTDERLRQWLEIIGRSDLLALGEVNGNSYRVCSAHFDESDFNLIQNLKKNAIPNSNLPNQLESSISSKKSLTVSTQTDENPELFSNVIIKKEPVEFVEVPIIEDLTEKETPTTESLTGQNPRKRKTKGEKKVVKKRKAQSWNKT